MGAAQTRVGDSNRRKIRRQKRRGRLGIHNTLHDVVLNELVILSGSPVIVGHTRDLEVSLPDCGFGRVSSEDIFRELHRRKFCSLNLWHVQRERLRNDILSGIEESVQVCFVDVQRGIRVESRERFSPELVQTGELLLHGRRELPCFCKPLQRRLKVCLVEDGCALRIRVRSIVEDCLVRVFRVVRVIRVIRVGSRVVKQRLVAVEGRLGRIEVRVRTRKQRLDLLRCGLHSTRDLNGTRERRP